MNSYLKALLLLALVILPCIGGYWIGHGKAAAEGKAALNALKVEHSDEQRRAADAYGKAVADALEKYRGEVARGDALAESLTAQDKTHATETKNLRRQIANATKNSTIVLGSDVVRLLNEAAGACVPEHAVPGTVHSAGAAGTAGTGAAPCAGLLDQFSGVTEADFVDWFLTYAQRAHWMEQRLAGWRQHFSSRPASAGRGK